MNFLIQGWLLGLAYVAPIGMQNMYLINSAIERDRNRALLVAMIIIFFDVTLALACFWGIGKVMEHFTLLKVLVTVIGSLAVIWIGVSLIRTTPGSEIRQDYHQPLLKVIATCFAVTWLNPQALIDGTLLLGGFRAILEPSASGLFIMGVALASTMWFTGLAVVVNLFKKSFSVKVLKAINIVCGVILIIFGIRLGSEFMISLIN
ncbi:MULTISPECIES: LysE/ArgO family amino acid transporter [unclassified Fusibacter]|uniref:LysE/ArgO family amino acid transporter n=1 Tax=unclassified Fusibacter TaxID=2624464 RepID=UPI0010119EFD|nr:MULTISPECIES: LysE family transporter [unclassified Fusibacter]MCK8058976.1 LysE family transporter [Fusibacter sp. A2]NPE22387.1 LysE family transporter [Fusibacter sp. A1]RXV60493.1 amino acid transporter [Fusibacter sp. A1]